MRKIRKDGGFWLCLLINLLLNLELTIPAWVLLGLRIWCDWPMWYVWVALALWPVVILIRMEFYSWLVRLGNQPDPPKENKNPYSAKGKGEREI